MGGNELLDHLITIFVKISSRLIFKIKSKKKKKLKNLEKDITICCQAGRIFQAQSRGGNSTDAMTTFKLLCLRRILNQGGSVG